MSNFLKILEVIRQLKSLWKWIEAYLLKKKQEGDLGKAQEGEKIIEDAGKIENDMERLKEKARGAKKIQDSIPR